MDKNQLGDTGILVSKIGLGTVKFGRNQGVKYPRGFDLPDEGALAELLSAAKDLGINTLDTAPSYGLSEERLGRLLLGQRDDWVIVGKVGEEFNDGVSRYDFTPEHFEMNVTRSLARLQSDYIDVLLVHCDDHDAQNLSDDVIAKMMEFKDRGIVRAIGASTKSVEGGLRALAHMDVAMVAYNPDYRDEEAVIDYATEHNKGVILKKVLSSGHSRNPAAALKFALSRDGVDSVIVGTLSPAHLRANVSAV